jgi:hypothetical protein
MHASEEKDDTCTGYDKPSRIRANKRNYCDSLKATMLCMSSV